MSERRQHDNPTITFTDDEFLLLASILHHINLNIKEARDDEAMVSYGDFRFDRGYGTYAVFRGLVAKMHEINLRKAIESMGDAS